ncbi:MAG TPA: hypothetical protein PL131_00370 [Methylotenera sp.]|mgnify:CR=1 FL=1|nr:hypothetical protein [Methylotenera sp.]HPH04299.1 hypothetical protein [Methylotenera sp.]HPM99853.1 hypothetical protein [Methylotenera sp.]
MEKFSSNDAIAQSLGYKKKTIDEIKREYGLENDAEYCGYLIHIIEKDEFLAYYEDDINVTMRAFCKSPEHAVRFNEIADAIKLARPDKGEAIVMLFDVGNQYIVYGIN